MPTATEVDNFRVAATVAVVHPSPESDVQATGGGKWQQRHQERRRFNKFGISIYGTKSRDGRPSQGTEEWRPNCDAVTCVHRTQDGVNLCTDILLQPELYLDLFSHRGKYST